jgi:hypothetical protein
MKCKRSIDLPCIHFAYCWLNLSVSLRVIKHASMITQFCLPLFTPLLAGATHAGDNLVQCRKRNRFKKKKKKKKRFKTIPRNWSARFGSLHHPVPLSAACRRWTTQRCVRGRVTEVTYLEQWVGEVVDCFWLGGADCRVGRFQSFLYQRHDL